MIDKEEILLLSPFEDEILTIIENQMSTDGRDLTQSDLQGVVSVIVRKIYNKGKEAAKREA